MKTTFTKANISEETLFWLFGVEFGIIDCSIQSLTDLEQFVDQHYKKQEIIDLTLSLI